MDEFIDVPPDAGRVIYSLRDTGYSFNTAIADLIDNSISAGARNIHIRIDMELTGDVHVSIADDGSGMDKDTLINAMRYGSPAQSDPERLGKFGLGLKTASTAFCTVLEVTTRNKPAVKAICAAWDLEEVVRRNAFKLHLKDPDSDAIDLLDEVAPGASGTVVVWNKIDRLFGRQYKDRSGAFAKKALTKTVESLRDHLGVTFQRFLEGKVKKFKGKLNIKIGDVEVEPWDPFCRSEKSIDEDKNTLNVAVGIEGKGVLKEAPCTINVVILPAEVEFSSSEAYKQARVSQDYQGLYVYRHDRLLTYGTWLGMQTVHPSHNMLRVELSFDYRLDDAFSVPVDKATIAINEELADYINKTYLAVPIKEAEKRRIKGQHKKASRSPNDIHKGSNQVISQSADSIKQPVHTVLDAAAGVVEIQNSTGNVRINIPVRSTPGLDAIFILPVPELQDGVLFEPALINGRQAVQINTSHDYYRKIYLPNKDSGSVIQGIDSLLWAICIAELNNCTRSTAQAFTEIRFEVSRTLRNLVKDMPDPVMEVDG